MDYSIMWFGFQDQEHALGFGDGRFRLRGEWYLDYNTMRNVADISDNSYGTRRVVNIPTEPEEVSIDHADRMRQHLISQFQWEVIA